MSPVPETIENFESITGFPLVQYLIDYNIFVKSHYQNILQYYSGTLNKVPETAFNSLQSLLKRSVDLSNLIYHYHNQMRDGSYWELIELLSTIEGFLLTAENSSKWLRSAITKNNFNPNAEMIYMMRKFQTLERISSGILGSSNPEKDWVTIALRNDLEEEEYTSQGGVPLSISTQGKFTLKLKSVVDNISEERVYGLDLLRRLTFEDDDLKALPYKKTFIQTVEILSSLKQGMTPEFPSNGLQGSLIQGTNVASVPYQIIFRQLQSTFSQDDTIRSLSITKISTLSDSLSIDLVIESRFGEIVPQTINTSQL
jgi:hypothetical protein